MALDFSPATGDRRVECTDTALNDLDPATFCALVYRKSNLAGSERLLFKSSGPGRHGLIPATVATFPGWSVLRGRVTVTCQADAPFANFAADGMLKWLFVVGQTDTGTAGNNKVFVGDAALPAAEPSVYTTQLAGSGTVTSNAGVAFDIGNQTTGNLSFNGFIAWVGATSGLLTTAQLHTIQRILFHGRPTGPIVVPGVTWLLDCRVGYQGTGRSVDFSGRHVCFTEGPRVINDPAFLHARQRVLARAAATGKPWHYYAQQMSA